MAAITSASTVNTATCPAVPASKVTSIGIGTVATAMAQLSDEASNPVVIMNKLTWADFKAAQYAANYPVDPFEGCEVLFNDTLKAFSAASTNDTWLIVGDLQHGALANFPNGDEISIKVDENTLMTQDLVRVLGREYVAVGVVAPYAFVRYTK